MVSSSLISTLGARRAGFDAVSSGLLAIWARGRVGAIWRGTVTRRYQSRHPRRVKFAPAEYARQVMVAAGRWLARRSFNSGC